jgi:hypothetical protein
MVAWIAPNNPVKFTRVDFDVWSSLPTSTINLCPQFGSKVIR